MKSQYIHAARTHLRSALAPCLLLVLAACQAPAATQPSSTAAPAATTAAAVAPIVIKYAHASGAGHPSQYWGEKFAAAVDQKTNGRVKVQIFPGGQLGQDPEVTQAILAGTVDMQNTGSAQLSQFVPESSVLELPYLFKNNDQFFKFQDNFVPTTIGPKFETKGLKILGFADIGISTITNSKRPLETPSDLKGLKIRVAPGQLLVELMKAFGATVVPMNYGEVYSALQQGVVDGEENPPGSVEFAKFYEVQKYMTLTSHQYLTNPSVIGVKQFNSYAPDVQKALVDAGREATIATRAYVLDGRDQTIAGLKAKGMIVNTPKDLQPWIDAALTIYPKFTDVAPPDLVKQIQAIQ